MIALPENVGEQLGLGPLFQMAPFTPQWHKLSLTTTDGAMVLHVLTIADVAGKRGYVFTPESLDLFSTATLHAATGLVIPHNGKAH